MKAVLAVGVSGRASFAQQKHAPFRRSGIVRRADPSGGILCSAIETGCEEGSRGDCARS